MIASPSDRPSRSTTIFIQKLEGLRAKVDGGNAAAVTAAANEIDTACTDGQEAVINAYVAAETELLAQPSLPPQLGPMNHHQPQP